MMLLRLSMPCLSTQATRHFFVSGLLLLVCLLTTQELVWGQTAATQSTPSSLLNASFEERALAALELSKIAARSHQLDISILAMKKAVIKGPPVASIKISGLLSGGTVSSSQSNWNQEPQAETFQQSFAESLQEIDQLWQTQKIDPQVAYRAWKEIVLPPDRPVEVIVYAVIPVRSNQSYSSSISLNSSDPDKPVASVAKVLVDWAHAADQEDDLKSAIQERERHPAAAVGIATLQLLLSQETPKENQVQVIEKIINTPSLSYSPESAAMTDALFHLLKKIPADNPIHGQVKEKLLTETTKNNLWFHDAQLKYYWEEQFRKSLATSAEDVPQIEKLLLSQLDNIRERNQSYVGRIESEFYSQISKSLAEKGKAREALEYLTKSLHTAHTSASPRTSPLTIESPLFVLLLKLPSEERFKLLNEFVWNQHALGLSDCFYRPISEAPPEFQDPSLMLTDVFFPQGAEATTILEWCMKDAVLLNNTDVIEEKIQALKEARSDDAYWAELLWQFVRGVPVETSLLIIREEEIASPSDSEQAAQKFRSLMPHHQTMPFEIEIARRLATSPETAAFAAEYIKHLNQSAESNLKHRIFEVETLLSPDKPKSQNMIWKHWISNDHFAKNQFNRGTFQPSQWRKESGILAQRTGGSSQNTLLLKYPLEGEVAFKVAFSENDSPILSLGGLTLTLNSGRFLHITTHGHQTLNYHNYSTPVLSDDRNPPELVYQNGRFIYKVSNHEDMAIEYGEIEFPFAGIGSQGSQSMSITKVDIEGTPTIPRQVNMITPGLLGWSSPWRDVTIRIPENLQFEAHNTSHSQSDSQVSYDWDCVDGMMISIDHQARAIKAGKFDPTKPQKDNEKSAYRHQKTDDLWLNYSRPLLTGESVECEFYYEKGKYSFSPSIGRISYQFEDDSILQHWITSESSGIWHGVKSDNQIPVPQEFLEEELTLHDQSWNKARISIENDLLTLAINDKVIVKRTIEQKSSHLFGIVHRPKNFQVKIRKMVLSGPWPESLPEDLFAQD